MNLYTLEAVIALAPVLAGVALYLALTSEQHVLDALRRRQHRRTARFVGRCYDGVFANPFLPPKNPNTQAK